MRTRPARSVSTFSHLPAGEGATPAVHMTTLLAIRSPPTTTPSASIWPTLCPKRTSTPRVSNRCQGLGELRSEGAQDPRRHVHQHNAGRRKVDTAKLRFQLGTNQHCK